jgi:FAD/FMN-containing dehydrogenase
MGPAEIEAHAQRRAALRQGWDASGAPPRLAKPDSNLFRDRSAGPQRRLDLHDFCHVLQIDTAAGWVDVEGLVCYDALVDATLPQGVMPAVVPQLKSITVAGAVAGVGIEATSFRQGLVHDTLLALDVLLPSGEIVHCTPDNEHADLFHGFPNSYGTLGYALRLRLRTLPVKPFVRVRHRRFERMAEFMGALAEACGGDADFVDGVAFAPDRLVLSVAHFADTAISPSDYTFERIYYQSLLQREHDELRTLDYLWRWDTDWFWCSRQFGAQRPWIRRLLGRERLNSRHYARWMRLNARLGLSRRLARWRGLHSESVIQDVDIPFDHAPQFLDFLQREIGIWPVWLCPIRAAPVTAQFPLYPLSAGTRMLNFGFWDVVQGRQPAAPGHYNRLIERKVIELGGIKSLYSDSFFTREEFDAAYGTAAYAALKARYDPQQRLLGLYEKCVLRA